MFKAVLEESDTFKKLIDSIKEIVKMVNIDVNPGGMCIQAMDSSHVALVLLKLEDRGFSDFRCDKPRTLGINVENLCKILKCANSDDSLTMSCDDESSLLKFTFESKSKTIVI
jgi:proliferating cell nuclear antigen